MSNKETSNQPTQEEETNTSERKSDETGVEKDDDVKEQVEDDESGEDDDDDEEEEDDPEPEQTAEELRELAKAKLKQGKYDEALGMFSWAIVKKERDFKDVVNPGPLGPYFLDYGNALLTKEENDNELFSFTKGPLTESMQAKKKASDADSATASSPSKDQAGESSKEAKEEAPKEDDANVTDEQLAWENLETARMCFNKLLEEETKAGSVSEDTVVGASFVNIRLGDMLTLQERFHEACKEYEAAIELRKEHKLPYPRIQAPMLSLAQARLFAGDSKHAIDLFRDVLGLLQDNLAGVGGHVVEEEMRADFEATVEDLQIQIRETELSLGKGDQEVVISPRTGHQRLRILPDQSAATTSTFDTPTLGGQVFSVDTSKAIVTEAAPGSPQNTKKRRIDLTEVNAKMAAAKESSSNS